MRKHIQGETGHTHRLTSVGTGEREVTTVEVSTEEISKVFNDSLKAKCGPRALIIAKGPRHKASVTYWQDFFPKGLYQMLRRKMGTGQGGGGTSEASD